MDDRNDRRFAAITALLSGPIAWACLVLGGLGWTGIGALLFAQRRGLGGLSLVLGVVSLAVPTFGLLGMALGVALLKS